MKTGEWKKDPALHRECRTCEGTGTILFDCKEEKHCMSGGHGAPAGHDVECPCCEGSGGQP